MARVLMTRSRLAKAPRALTRSASLTFATRKHALRTASMKTGAPGAVAILIATAHKFEAEAYLCKKVMVAFHALKPEKSNNVAMNALLVNGRPGHLGPPVPRAVVAVFSTEKDSLRLR